MPMLHVQQKMSEANMEKKQENVFLRKSFVAITGASRGLGRSMALQFVDKLPPTSVIVLMARNEQALQSVKSEIVSKTTTVTVLVQQFDQGNVEKDNFKGMFDQILSQNKLSSNDFEQFMVVHNCAVITAASKNVLDLCDAEEVRSAFDINVTGMILLNTSFFQTFSDSSKSRVVVNVSSSAAANPIQCMHLYCAGKAARDMYMRVLAAEEPSLRILTFAPGASDTDMMRGVESCCLNKELIGLLKHFREIGKMTKPDTPISKMVEILEENKFENAVYMESDKVF
ncbi:sepiapterin reductase-like [Argopecten irradians]|uniref:sepiapterin reductase-like n=1 Tax=Argopecten irradians TaxID=31199 RepID=UPI00371D15DC